MADTDQEPTQQTEPKKGKPIEIPVPKRGDVIDFLEKTATLPDPDRTATVYVPLLGEGVDVWRPVTATLDRDGAYRLPDREPDGEAWVFSPGTLVRCERRKLADGDELVAVAAVDV
jgi:hypothetical protein